MALEAYPTRATSPEVVEHHFRLLGGTTAVTKESGSAPGVTAAYSTTGTYTLTFTQDPGTFLNWGYGLGAATPGDLAGHTAIRDTWDTTNHVFTFIVYNASFAAHDLAANEYIDITLRFQRGAV